MYICAYLRLINWQVINYGIGGHYFLHMDYFDFGSSNHTDTRSRYSIDLGDRIATVLFYVSNYRD